MSAEFRIILDDETTPERRPPAPPAAGAQPPPTPVPPPAGGTPPPAAGPARIPVADAGLLADVLAETVARMGALPQGQPPAAGPTNVTYSPGMTPPAGPPAAAATAGTPPPPAAPVIAAPAGTPPPTAGPVAPAPVTSAVPVFDRPQPVVIVGPRPLPVTMEGGPGGSSPPPPPAPPKPTDYYGAAGRAAQVAGGATAQAFGGNNVGALAGAAGAVGAALGSIPGPAGAVGKALQAGAVAVGALERVVGAVVERGRELQNYSGRLAVANANADIIRMAADIREATANGKQMARVIETNARAQAEINDSLNGLKRELLAALPALIATGTTAVTTSVKTAEFLYRFSGVRVAVEGIKALNEKRAERQEAEQRRKDVEAVDSLFDSLLDAGRAVKPFGVNPDALGDLKAQKLAGPTFSVGQ